MFSDHGDKCGKESGDGHGLGWHFDRSEFGVSLLLVQPRAGGQLEYHKDTRNEADLWSYAKVQDVLAAGSAHPEVSVAREVEPGDIVIFNGKMSMHRVLPVSGCQPRINAILTYEREPNAKLNAYSLRKFFGRFAAGT
eukprot:2253368-Amphidinium_carterae.1